jgi:hypothetical protein
MLVFLRAAPAYHFLMMNAPPRELIRFDRPAAYQISVQGRVDPDWAGFLAGMTIRLTTEEASPPITTLEGELSDQAALLGVLNALYELHLTVLSVLWLSHPPDHKVDSVEGTPVS